MNNNELLDLAIENTGDNISTESKNDNSIIDEGVYYTKIKKTCFSVKGLTFIEIPVVQSVKLSFFEKYTVLLLQKGLRAFDLKEAAEKISSILNVSEKCIAEFLDYLKGKSILEYDYTDSFYRINPAIHFFLDKNYDNAMFADLDVKYADCDKIVLIEQLKTFYLDDDFSKEVFVRKGRDNNGQNEALPQWIVNLVYDSKESLKPLFVRSFEETNLHLQNDFDYTLCEDKYKDYQFEFEVLIDYKYIKEEHKAIRQNVCALKDNILPKEFLNVLTSQYEIDDSLPKFIELDEDFYQKVSPSTNKLTYIENEIEIINNNTYPVEQQVAQDKRRLIKLTQDYSKAEKRELNEAAELKKVIEELKENIREKEKELEENNNFLKEYEQQQKEIAKEYESLLAKNNELLNPVIKNVLKKYPATKNVFFRYIADICTWLDSAISASECDAFDEIGRCFDFIREMYRKVLQAVFDVALKKKSQNLGKYFLDPYSLIAIEDMFRKRKVPLDVKNKLIIFHGLANAIGHSIENGPQKHDNEKRVSDFKKLNNNEREKILLAVPNLFSAIEFTQNEITAIVARLKI